MEIEPVIGLEIHTELSTQSKMFCHCSTRFGAPPNTQVCPVCLGLPGVLPVVNKEAVRIGVKTCLALNCKINRYTRFDRKNYYYPDLPKNYQISQQYIPIGVEGWVEFEVGEAVKKVRIHNIHLEEDAGKNIHEERKNFSLVDLNRAGIPLLEIVTYPDMRSVEEVDSFMNELRNILIYIGASNCKMEEGHLRFEANISVREKGSETLGPKVEMKNLNSFKAVLQALEYEIKRQGERLRRGEPIHQETRLWNEEEGKSFPMRFKEEAQDYRYFPEPDIPPLEISEEMIEEIKATLPELPLRKKRRFIEEYGLNRKEAEILTEEKEISQFFEETVKIYPNPKKVVNWLIGPVMRELNERGITVRESKITPGKLAKIIGMVEDSLITQTNAKYCLHEVFDSGEEPEKIVDKRGWKQVTDTGEIEKIVSEAIQKNPRAVKDLRNGKKQALGFLIGQVMRLSQGKANPGKVREILERELVRK